MSRPALLITGGARRIGAELARHFARNGYDVGIHYNNSAKEAEALAAELRSLGVQCVLFRHDLLDTAGFPALMDKVKKVLPSCEALINNASIFERGVLMETDEALFDRQFAVNFKAPFFLTQAFARTFGKGCVLNLLDTDIAQRQGSHFAYLLSKKTLAEFTLMAARQLGPDVRVNGVCPGYVLPHSPEDAAHIRQVEKVLPLKGHGTPDDVCEAAFWLCRQKHVTGQIIYIDGGKHVLY